MNLATTSVTDWNPNFIDRSPLFLPFAHLRHRFEDLLCWPRHEDLNNLITSNQKIILTQSGKAIRFVPQATGKQNLEQQYEARIYLTGEIQTRINNWHDFFNALVWKIFPHTKSMLNQIHFQAQQFESSNSIKNRCGLRDAATLFDESGIIVVSEQSSLARLLVDFEWKSLFWRQRDAVLQSMRFFVFGHGLYEKALNPYTGMTGKGIILDVDQTFFTQTLPKQLSILDTMLASFLSDTKLSKSLMTPVPILGYPGWIEENRHEAYYDNEQYFRNRHRKSPDLTI